MMKLNDYLTDNIFDLMRKVNPELTFLTDDNIRTLDGLLKLNYGERQIFSKIENHSLQMVAEFLVNLYGDNWLRLVELNVMGFDMGNDRTITETINETENRNNASETINKVSAFNSDELLTDDGNSVTGSDDIKGNKTRTLTDSRKTLVSLYNNLSLTHKNHIMRVVLNDVKDFLTLTIY